MAENNAHSPRPSGTVNSTRENTTQRQLNAQGKPPPIPAKPTAKP